MSSINAIITEVKSVGSLNIVRFDFFGNSLEMMSLDLSQEMQVGRRVRLSVKPFHITIAKDFSRDISYSNQLQAEIKSCEHGELLSSIKLFLYDEVLESIITKERAVKMGLKVGEKVFIMIKASDLSITEVKND